MRFWNRQPDFERSVRSELPVLYRVARRLARDPEAAQDLVQQTLLCAYKGWARFDGGFLRSWLIRILRNEHLAGQPRATREAREVELDEAAFAEDGGWDRIIWRNQAHRILEEVERLPDDFRLAIQLCDVEEMSYSEAALAMNVPVGTLKSRLFRARSAIRRRLGEPMEAGGAR